MSSTPTLSSRVDRMVEGELQRAQDTLKRLARKHGEAKETLPSCEQARFIFAKMFRGPAAELDPFDGVHEAPRMQVYFDRAKELAPLLRFFRAQGFKVVFTQKPDQNTPDFVWCLELDSGARAWLRASLHPTTSKCKLVEVGERVEEREPFVRKIYKLECE